MTSKELRRLSRQDLLELLLRQQRENETLTAKLAELEKQLQDRAIHIRTAGSMAEAALVLNGVFADADKAVEQYIENIRRCSEEQQKAYDKIVLAAEQRATEIIGAAEEEKQKNMEEADAYWRQLRRSLEEFCQNRKDIEELLQRIK